MILIPKVYFDLGVIGDALSIWLLLLFRRPRKPQKPPTETQIRGLGAYLVFMSFFVLLFTRAFANHPSYFAWGVGVALCALMFYAGFSLMGVRRSE